jgi:hypothetical protein
MHALRQPHYEAIYRILRYLKGAPRRGLLYKPSASLFVTGFSDAFFFFFISNNFIEKKPSTLGVY